MTRTSPIRIDGYRRVVGLNTSAVDPRCKGTKPALSALLRAHANRYALSLTTARVTLSPDTASMYAVWSGAKVS